VRLSLLSDEPARTRPDIEEFREEESREGCPDHRGSFRAPTQIAIQGQPADEFERKPQKPTQPKGFGRCQEQ